MKSFLDMLTKEKSLVDEYEMYERYLNIVQNQLDSIEICKIDCEPYRRDVRMYHSMINEYSATQAIILDKIKSCRKELREYLINEIEL